MDRLFWLGGLSMVPGVESCTRLAEQCQGVRVAVLGGQMQCRAAVTDRRGGIGPVLQQ